MEITKKHALVIPLYGEFKSECLDRLKDWKIQGYWVIVVNNNPVGSSLKGVVASAVIAHHNRQGLAGGFNAGVNHAIENEAECITLLDQDSIISSTSLINLAKECDSRLIVGPRIVDRNRGTEHKPTHSKIKMLISSGTTFRPSIWKHVGPFRGWMEIDYIDHEWCSRARTSGIDLKVVKDATLIQTFGSRHPNILAHHLGLQLYSPYRRSIALRNLRWLLLQHFVPLDIRAKELIKMMVKPWIWLILEPRRRQCLAVIWIGLTAPLNEPFPKAQLEKSI